MSDADFSLESARKAQGKSSYSSSSKLPSVLSDRNTFLHLMSLISSRGSQIGLVRSAGILEYAGIELIGDDRRYIIYIYQEDGSLRLYGDFVDKLGSFRQFEYVDGRLILVKASGERRVVDKVKSNE